MVFMRVPGWTPGALLDMKCLTQGVPRVSFIRGSTVAGWIPAFCPMISFLHPTTVMFNA